MSAAQKDDTLKGAATGSPEGASPVDENVEEAIEAEVIEEQDEVQENTPNLFEAITAEVTELRDRYARLQAEWDNYRKRTQAERESERVRASENLVMDLLPLLDDLERAIKHARETGEGGTLTDGVEAIQNKFLQLLEKHKVTQIAALGEPFDAMQHQAVGTGGGRKRPRGDGRQRVPARLQDGRACHTPRNGRDEHRRPRTGAARS